MQDAEQITILILQDSRINPQQESFNQQVDPQASLLRKYCIGSQDRNQREKEVIRSPVSTKQHSTDHERVLKPLEPWKSLFELRDKLLPNFL